MVGKFGPIFPMIGKIFRRFSNDWKKFSGWREGSGWRAEGMSLAAPRCARIVEGLQVDNRRAQK